MPKLIIPNDNIHWSVERPVFMGVVKDIAHLTQITPKTQLNFFGPEGKRYQESSTMGYLGWPENNWDYNEQLQVEVNEEYDIDHVLSIALTRNEHQPIFYDPNLNVYIKPIYALCKATISFQYRAVDLNQANRWRQNMIMQSSSMFSVNLHEVEYDYYLSEEILSAIMQVWQKRESVAGYGESAAHYFTKHLTPRAHLISSQNGATKAWAIKEKQIEVQGYFDFEKIPEKAEKAGDHDTFTSSFSYIFQYQKPIGCVIRYPLVIHNQMVDEQFIIEKEIYDLDKKRRRQSWSMQCANTFRSDVDNTIAFGYEGYNLPSFDDWRPARVLPTTVKIFTAQVAICEQDKRSLLNLKELGKISLQSDIVDFLSNGEYAHVCELYRSIFQLVVYEDDEPLDSSQFTLTSNLDVIGLRDFDLRKNYHVRFSLVTDIRYLKSTDIERVRFHEDISIRIADAINASINGFCGTRADIAKQKLSDTDYKILTGKDLIASYGRSHKPHFVAQFLLTTGAKPFDQYTA